MAQVNGEVAVRDPDAVINEIGAHPRGPGPYHRRAHRAGQPQQRRAPHHGGGPRTALPPPGPAGRRRGHPDHRGRGRLHAVAAPQTRPCGGRGLITAPWSAPRTRPRSSGPRARPRRRRAGPSSASHRRDRSSPAGVLVHVAVDLGDLAVDGGVDVADGLRRLNLPHGWLPSPWCRAPGRTHRRHRRGVLRSR